MKMSGMKLFVGLLFVATIAFATNWSVGTGPVSARPQCGPGYQGKQYSATDCLANDCSDNGGTLHCESLCIDDGNHFFWHSTVCVDKNGVVTINPTTSTTTTTTTTTSTTTVTTTSTTTTTHTTTT